MVQRAVDAEEQYIKYPAATVEVVSYHMVTNMFLFSSLLLAPLGQQASKLRIRNYVFPLFQTLSKVVALFGLLKEVKIMYKECSRCNK